MHDHLKKSAMHSLLLHLMRPQARFARTFCLHNHPRNHRQPLSGVALTACLLCCACWPGFEQSQQHAAGSWRETCRQVCWQPATIAVSWCYKGPGWDTRPPQTHVCAARRSLHRPSHTTHTRSLAPLHQNTRAQKTRRLLPAQSKHYTRARARPRASCAPAPQPWVAP